MTRKLTAPTPLSIHLDLQPLYLHKLLLPNQIPPNPPRPLHPFFPIPTGPPSLFFPYLWLTFSIHETHNFQLKLPIVTYTAASLA
jgi:hypothetical protein